MSVYLSASVPFSEFNAFSVSLDKFMDKISNGKFPRWFTSVKLLPMHSLVVASEVQLHFILEDVGSYCFAQESEVLDTLLGFKY